MPKELPTRTTPRKLNSKELTPSEWSKLHREALTLYKDAVWNLAEVMKLGKEKFGRNTLWTMTPLAPNKVTWLVGITTVPRNSNLLPEHHSEVIGLSDAKKWLTKAEKENLDPVNLRKQVRKGHCNVKKEKAVQVCSWSKNFLLIEKEIKDLDPDQRQRVIEFMKSKLNET